ncbi:uncharacterized protein LOC144636134 isoform X2 [Oculina patagonica]
MATSPDPDELLHSTTGKNNFQRITRLLISGGTTLLREIFDQRCPPSNLPAKLNPILNPGIEKQLKAAKLTMPQWDCLYPSPGVYGKSGDFDVTLLFRLLRTICNLIPPVSGWDAPPAGTDHSLASDLVRVKNFRNSVYGHVNQNMEIADEEFPSLWREISETLIRIAVQISPEKKQGWQKAIDNFLTDPLTTDDERNIQELQKWYENDKEVKKSLQELETTTQNVQRQVQEEAQDIKDKLSEIHQSIDGLRYSAGSSQVAGARLQLRIVCEKISGPGLQEGSSEATSYQQEASATAENRNLPTAQGVLNFIALKYFDVVDPSKPEERNDFLKYLIDVRKLLFVDAQQGSLIITVECGSLEILEELWKDYRSGHLNEMAQKHLITKDILKEFDLTEVKLMTTILQEEYLACRQYFLQSAVPSPTKSATDFNRPQVEASGQENQVPIEPEESKSQQDNAAHCAPSDNVDTSLVNIEDISSSGDNYPANIDLQIKESDLLRHAAVGIAAGTAAVVAAPLVLGAVGFTAGGVAAGSIAASVQSAVYGGSVASGSAFALLQSAGAAGIGAAGNAAIAGITGGIAALGAKMFDSRTVIKLLICGCGNEAHAFASIASSLKGTEVRVLSLYQDEAERWSAAVEKSDLEVTLHRKGKEPTSIKSKPSLVTKNPEDAMRDVDIVVFVLPAFAHEVLLDAIKPHIKPGTIIVGLPGGPGFEFQVREVLGDVARQCTIMNFESSPWVSRTTEFGVKCEVLGTKETLLGAMKQGEGVAPKKDPVSTLQYLLGPIPKLNVSGHLLGVTLMSTDAYLHPSILYGQWKGWDGKPLDEPPLFYNGLTEPAANLLSSVSDEVVKTAKVVGEKSGTDMSNVVHIYQWYMRCYPNNISDKTSLYTAIQTNAAYQGLKHPVKKTEDGKFMPDFTYRYMTEDIPYGLAVIRGIAEIAGLETPNIDKVLTWCQEKMGKEYLVNSKLQGKDVSSSRAPQRYGFTTLESIL